MLTSIGNNFTTSAPSNASQNTSFGNVASRAVANTIPSPISSAQSGNNASGYRNNLPTNTNSSATETSGNLAQAQFLAHVASGDLPPAVQGFAQYDKLLSYAAEKYAPSDAGKPTAPASPFETIS